VEAPPPAVGVRLAWSSVPVGLRHAVEQELGGAVVEAVTQSGGFSPGVAARLTALQAADDGVPALAARLRAALGV